MGLITEEQSTSTTTRHKTFISVLGISPDFMCFVLRFATDQITLDGGKKPSGNKTATFLACKMALKPTATTFLQMPHTGVDPQVRDVPKVPGNG